MKINALRRFRQSLASGSPALGLWVTLESASITEMAVALGFDWVVVDAEHGHLDWREVVEHVRAAVRSDTVVLVRVAENSAALIKRALDLGADGVVVPWVSSADELRAALAAAKYPPAGKRGIGAERATCWGQCIPEHVRDADANILVVPILESVEAIGNVEAMLRVPGAEVFFFGPADLSSTAGAPGAWEGPGVAAMIAQAREAIRRNGKHCGIVATSDDNLAVRASEGFRMLAVGIDGALLLRSLHVALARQGRDRRITPSFTLENDPLAVASEAPVLCAPPNLRPDRSEVMNQPGRGPQVEVGPRVTCDVLVGAHNHAKKLMTGVVAFAPGAVLAYHRHGFGEAITLLKGRAMVEVEGRAYTLGELDNVAIPAGLAHRVTNLSRSEQAVFHVAMASAEPTRELVGRFFPTRSMPAVTRSQPGGERVTFMPTAEPYEPGSNASFVDYFNAELVPGFELSGGYGLFRQGGRLPAHLHDFDESICIIQGDATCVVEGRRYRMSNLMTALQPRGRIHYFINETAEPMAMIWVYAGPRPERLVVDERCATAEGVAWGGVPAS